MFSSLKNKFSNQSQVHIFYLDGVIEFGESNSLTMKKSKIEDLIEDLRDAADKNVDGIVLRINSPGGAAGASEELAQTVLKVREKNIPVIASVGELACSGAYMVAACCDYIFANKMSLVGSIGVIMQIPNFKNLSEKLGATLVTIKAGKMKDIGNPFKEMTDEEKIYLETLTKKSHEYFIELVTSQREILDLENMTDGRIIDAKTALDNNLIDSYGTFHDALNFLAEEKLHTEVEKLKIVRHKAKKSFINKILGTCNFNVTLDNSILTNFLDRR